MAITTNAPLYSTGRVAEAISAGGLTLGSFAHLGPRPFLDPTHPYYGADPTGVNDSTTAIQNAANNLSAAGGGAVWLNGLFKISGANGIVIPNNVFFLGAGPLNTKVVNTSGACFSTPTSGDTTYIGIRGMWLEGTTSVDTEYGIWLNFTSYAWLEDLLITNFAHAGIQLANSCNQVFGRNIAILSIKQAVSGVGGNAIWFYKGTTNCQFSSIYVNGCDAAAIVYDAGTTTGTSTPVQNCHTHGLVAVNAASGSVASKVINFEGAYGCSVDGFSIQGTGSAESYGVEFLQDQSGYTNQDCWVANGYINNVGSHAFVFCGAARCSAKNVKVHNIGMNAGSDPAYLVEFVGGPALTNGQNGNTPNDCIDCDISDITMLQDGATGKYTYGLYAAADPGGSGKMARRCHADNVLWGSPASGLMNSDGTAPLYGTDASYVKLRSGPWTPLTGTSLNVTGVEQIYVTQSGATNVSALTGGVNGQAVRLIFGDGNSTVVNGASLALNGATNFAAAANSTLSLTFRNGVWYEVARSAA